MSMVPSRKENIKEKELTNLPFSLKEINKHRSWYIGGTKGNPGTLLIRQVQVNPAFPTSAIIGTFWEIRDFVTADSKEIS